MPYTRVQATSLGEGQPIKASVGVALRDNLKYLTNADYSSLDYYVPLARSITLANRVNVDVRDLHAFLIRIWGNGHHGGYIFNGGGIAPGGGAGGYVEAVLYGAPIRTLSVANTATGWVITGVGVYITVAHALSGTGGGYEATISNGRLLTGLVGGDGEYGWYNESSGQDPSQRFGGRGGSVLYSHGGQGGGSGQGVQNTLATDGRGPGAGGGSGPQNFGLGAPGKAVIII